MPFFNSEHSFNSDRTYPLLKHTLRNRLEGYNYQNMQPSNGQNISFLHNCSVMKFIVHVYKNIYSLNILNDKVNLLDYRK